MIRKLTLWLIFLTAPAWAAYRDSTTATGNSQFPSTAVPAGVAIDDIVILVATQDGTSGVFDPGDWPTGFVELCEVTNTLDGQKTAVGWKRLTAVDSGSYTFASIAGIAPWIAQAYAFSGRDTVNPPVVANCTDVNNTGNSSPVTITASGLTALLGDDMLAISSPDVNTDLAGTGHTPPTNYTEREDDENSFDNLSGATRDNVSAGATGSVSFSFTMTTGTAGWSAFHIRIPAVATITPVGAATLGQLAMRRRRDILMAATVAPVRHRVIISGR